MNTLAVVEKGLEAVALGRSQEVLSKLECIEYFQIGDNNNSSPNNHPSVNTINLHVTLIIIYQASHITSNFFR